MEENRRKRITEKNNSREISKWIVTNFQTKKAQVRSRMNGNRPALRHIAGILEAKRGFSSFQRRGKDHGWCWIS